MTPTRIEPIHVYIVIIIVMIVGIVTALTARGSEVQKAKHSMDICIEKMGADAPACRILIQRYYEAQR